MAAARLGAFAAPLVCGLALAAPACEVSSAGEENGGGSGGLPLGSAGTNPSASGSGGAESAGGSADAGTSGRAGAAASGSVGKGGAGGKSGASGGGAGTASGRGGSSTTGSGGGGPIPETGCGAARWPLEREHTLVVDGLTRQFSLAVPTGYDPTRAYPVIFSWHGLGGSMGNFYQLNSASRAGSAAIHLSPQGLDNAEHEGPGWWNTDGQDLAFVDALIDWVSGYYCVDETRLFSVGFSFGAMFTHLLACERGRTFRAIAPIAGSFYDYYGTGVPPACDEPVPMLGIHGINDDRVALADGEAARDTWVAANGCTAVTAAAEPPGCVLYQGCRSGYPVEWCTHEGDHVVPSFAADVVWEFFGQF